MDWRFQKLNITFDRLEGKKAFKYPLAKGDHNIVHCVFKHSLEFCIFNKYPFHVHIKNIHYSCPPSTQNSIKISKTKISHAEISLNISLIFSIKILRYISSSRPWRSTKRLWLSELWWGLSSYVGFLSSYGNDQNDGDNEDVGDDGGGGNGYEGFFCNGGFPPMLASFLLMVEHTWMKIRGRMMEMKIMSPFSKGLKSYLNDLVNNGY